MDERCRRTALEREVLLHEAVITSDVKVVRRVLEDGGKDLNVNCRNNYGRAPVHLAASRGNVEILGLLLKAGCDVEARDKFGMRPLHMAAWHGQREAAELLLEAGAGVSTVDKKQRTLLMMAMHSNCGADFLERVIGRLEPAAESRARDCEGASVLHHAARAGHSRAISSLSRLLPELDLDAYDQNGQTALHLACVCGHQEAAAQLLDLGASFELRDAEGCTALHLAARARESRLCCWLMDRCPGELLRAADRRGLTPLHVAASLGCAVILRAILASEADKAEALNRRCLVGNTALHLAARNNQPQVVDILVENGVPLDSVNDDALTPLQLASDMGHSQVCRQLLAARGGGGGRSDGVSAESSTASEDERKPTPKAEEERTALHVAARGSFAAIANMISRTARLDYPALLLQGTRALFDASDESRG